MESNKADCYNRQKLLKGKPYKEQLFKWLISFGGYITLPSNPPNIKYQIKIVR